MLIVVSPSKALDFESPLPTRRHSRPAMVDRSAELVEVMRTKSPDELSSLMSISPSLAELNFERFQDWQLAFSAANARPAVFAFNGDTYTGLAASSFTARDLTHAQKTLRILSGLYGVLRPLDLIQPYRLEMGSKLKTAAGDTLYDFWGDSITDALAADLAAGPGPPVLVNLSSAEYYSVVDPARLGARVVTPRFLQSTDGGPLKTIGLFAKRARGTMAGWIVRHRVRSVRALSAFDQLGYRFDAGRSTPAEPVFTRSPVS